MTLSWEMILREIDRYFFVLQQRFILGSTLEKALNDLSEELFSKNKTGPIAGAAMGGLARKAVSTSGESLPGDNFDLYGNATVAVAAGQAILTGIDIVGGAAGQMYVSRLLRTPRSFLSFSGSHAAFEGIMRGGPPDTKNLPALAD
uniref:hypothetical protein n=1 Tax=Leptospirillum ferriphilum TaxID=178606 RepID=UPI000A7E8A20